MEDIEQLSRVVVKLKHVWFTPGVNLKFHISLDVYNDRHPTNAVLKNFSGGYFRVRNVSRAMTAGPVSVSKFVYKKNSDVLKLTAIFH